MLRIPARRQGPAAAALAPVPTRTWPRARSIRARGNPGCRALRGALGLFGPFFWIHGHAGPLFVLMDLFGSRRSAFHVEDHSTLVGAR